MTDKFLIYLFKGGKESEGEEGGGQMGMKKITIQEGVEEKEEKEEEGIRWNKREEKG